MICYDQAEHLQEPLSFIHDFRILQLLSPDPKPPLHCHLFRQRGCDTCGMSSLAPSATEPRGRAVCALPFLQEVFGGCQDVTLHIVPCHVVKCPCGEGPSVRGSVVCLWTCLRRDKTKKILSVFVLPTNHHIRTRWRACHGSILVLSLIPASFPSQGAQTHITHPSTLSPTHSGMCLKTTSA